MVQSCWDGSWLRSKKADLNKVIELLIVHELVMAVIEDVTPSSKEYFKKSELEEKASKIIEQKLPKVARGRYRYLFAEYQKQETKEAIIAREAAKLETLLQAYSYEKESEKLNILDEFLGNYEPIFKTKLGKEIYLKLKK